jgi:DNA repair/transcription protein MET18/MMS19
VVSDPFSLGNNFLYCRLSTSGGVNELALSFALRLLDETKYLTVLDRISSQVKLYQIEHFC